MTEWTAQSFTSEVEAQNYVVKNIDKLVMKYDAHTQSCVFPIFKAGLFKPEPTGEYMVYTKPKEKKK